jgi:hypothetical protein
MTDTHRDTVRLLVEAGNNSMGDNGQCGCGNGGLSDIVAELGCSSVALG